MTAAPFIKLTCNQEPLKWLETCAAIIDDRGQLHQRIDCNVLQRRALYAWIARYRAGLPVRFVGLKPRKRGFSTISTAIHYWMMRVAPTKIGLLGHQDNASTQTLYRMLETYRDHDRNAWPNTPTKTATDEMRFSNRSGVIRLTSENPAKVRSETLQAISATEWAYWSNSDATLNAAMNAMPKGVFTSFIGESTPNGPSGSFADTWKNARWPTAAECPGGQEYWRQWESFLPQQSDTSVPDSEMFIRIFAAWFEFEDSHIKLTAAEQRAVEHSLDQEDWYYGEQDLIDRYLQTREDGQQVLGNEVRKANVWEQLAWRRARISTDCNRRLLQMNAEHPADPHTCFVSSGSPFFDPEAITTLDQYAKYTPPPDKGILEWTDVGSGIPTATWHESRSDSHLFLIWEHPREGCAYLVVIDPATGENNVEGGKPDRHSCLVIRQPYRDGSGRIHKPRVVARIRPPCLVPLHTVADWSARLASYYQALLVPEINNTGQAVVMALRQFPYIRIARRSSGEDPRTGRKQKRDLVGHLTDVSTRQAILDYLHKLLRNEAIETSCPHLIHELRIFNHDPDKDKPQAPEGEHDDDVMALAIGMHWLDRATPYVIPSRRRTDIRKDFANGGWEEAAPLGMIS